MANSKPLSIKNMVCPRCVMAVEQILHKLEIPFEQVVIGTVDLARDLTNEETIQFNAELQRIGFEILLDRKEKLVEEIKVALSELIRQESLNSVKTSVYLSDRFHLDYAYLSNLFSEQQGESLEKYLINLRVAKIKELLQYDLSLAEIADQLNYSSIAHLSNQFKKITGQSPSVFRKENQGQKD